MSRLLFTASIIGIIACITFNTLALTGIYIPNSISFMLPITIGMFAVFIPAVFKLQKLKLNDPIQPPKGIKGIIANQKKVKALMFSFWKPIPLGLKIFVVLIFVYGFINFFVMSSFLIEGQAEFENGKYFLESHGKFIREITENAYYQNKAYQTSLFTGHIAIFYSFAMLLHLKLSSQPAYKTTQSEE